MGDEIRTHEMQAWELARVQELEQELLDRVQEVQQLKRELEWMRVRVQVRELVRVLEQPPK